MLNVAQDPKTGSPFWSGAKKPPQVISFNPNDPLHIGFVTVRALPFLSFPRVRASETASVF